MLTITTELSESLCIWHLAGRLNGSGAAVFDREAGTLPSSVQHVILDLGEVDYLSSAGLRSLMLLERALRVRKGFASLCRIQPMITQVLDQAGLSGQFHAASNVEQAAEWIRQAKGESPMEVVTLQGRTYQAQRTGCRQQSAQEWGSFQALFATPPGKTNWTTAHLDELKLAFGFGALGCDRQQAEDGHGLFLAAGRLIALQPADGAGVPDFLVSAKPHETVCQISAAISLSGDPAFAIQGPAIHSVTLGDWVQDTAEVSGRQPRFAFCLAAQSTDIHGRYYRTAADLAAGQYTTLDAPATGDLLCLGLAFQGEQAGTAALSHEAGSWRILGGACWFPERLDLGDQPTLEGLLERLSLVETVGGVADLSPDTLLSKISAWLFLPPELESAPGRRLAVTIKDGTAFPPEWEAITRRIYQDVARVELTTLSGGFSATTYQAASWDHDGRRVLPTVLKISSLEFTDREEKAYHQYVEKFILNNSTVIMGRATRGQWSGLRYNFLGITGPESKLSWLHDHYRTRPVEELDPIFERLYAKILYPWYGQAQKKPVALFDDNSPLRLFPGLLNDVEKLAGISPGCRTIRCEPLELELPNPWWVLNTVFRERASWTLPWFSSITHGDLNMRNILLDEKENLYVIDFSETRLRNVYSDFARLEEVLKFHMIEPRTEEDLMRMLIFEQALLETESVQDALPFVYDGTDPMVAKAHHTIGLLRRLACGYTPGRTDLLPYLVALLEWTLPIPYFVQLSALQKRYALYSGALISRRVLQLLG